MKIKIRRGNAPPLTVDDVQTITIGDDGMEIRIGVDGMTVQVAAAGLGGIIVRPVACNVVNLESKKW